MSRFTHKIIQNIVITVVIGQTKTPTFPNFRKSDKKISILKFSCQKISNKNDLLLHQTVKIISIINIIFFL